MNKNNIFKDSFDSTHPRHSKAEYIADKGLPTSHFQNMSFFHGHIHNLLFQFKEYIIFT